MRIPAKGKCQKTLSLFRKSFCECCGRPGRTEAAHVFATGFNGGGRIDVAQNLVALNPECHYASHNSGKPSQKRLVEIVAKREKMTPEAVLGLLWELRRASKWSDWREIVKKWRGE